MTRTVRSAVERPRCFLCGEDAEEFVYGKWLCYDCLSEGIRNRVWTG
jgi:hypothetical protein